MCLPLENSGFFPDSNLTPFVEERVIKCNML